MFHPDTDWSARSSFTPATQQVPAHGPLPARTGEVSRDRAAAVVSEYDVAWWTAWRRVARAGRRCRPGRSRRGGAWVDTTGFCRRQSAGARPSIGTDGDSYNSALAETASENTNRLLRQYYSKGTDLCRWNCDEIEAVAAALNAGPATRSAGVFRVSSG